MRPSREFFTVDAITLARALLGCSLVRRFDSGDLGAGRIVEVEAYIGPEDLASHARGGRRTPRNEMMFARGGFTYVYFTYGMHCCLNVVSGPAEYPAAVLVRAVEPTHGLGAMRSLRLAGPKAPLVIPDRDLCRGPGRLCRALGIGLDLNGLDLCRDERMWIESRRARPGRIVATPRVGVSAAGPRWASRRLRFVLAGSPCVSGPSVG